MKMLEIKQGSDRLDVRFEIKNLHCYGSFGMIVEVVANVIHGDVLPDIRESYQVVEPSNLLHLIAIIVRLLLRIAALTLFLFAELIIVFPECPLCIC